MPKTKKKPVKRNPVGRPSKFPTLDKIQFKKLVLAGWDDAQVSDFFGIAVSTLTRWKKKNEEFCLSLKDWKREADLEVEKSLYKRAIGFEYDEVTYEKINTGGLAVGISKGEIKNIKHTPTYKTKVITKLVVPDVTAEIFWLKNRQPDKWRDKTEVSHPETENQTQEQIGKQLDRIEGILAKRKAGKG